MALIAARGSEGVWMLNGPPDGSRYHKFHKDDSCKSRTIAFSDDGSLFAWANGEFVTVMRIADSSIVQRIDKPKTSVILFSPKNSILATWEVYAVTKDVPSGTPNLHLWDLVSGECVKGFVQKKLDSWHPQWSDDEAVCARNVNNEIQCYQNNNFGQVVKKLHIQKVSTFKLSSGPSPPKMAVFVPGSKGAPSYVRAYQYPNLDGQGAALANKSFFKADNVSIIWNKKCTAVLIMASQDVDSTGASYYGETTLHYLGMDGVSSLVPLGKKGPVYAVEWSPSSTEFGVVYGFMPSKATLYSTKCEPVFDFGTGPRNALYFNAHGSILCLAGFGNLRGFIEVWDCRKFNMIAKIQAEDSTHFDWSPDCEHFMTATLSPRLRVGNGFKIWHYTGGLVNEFKVDKNAELYQVCWQKAAEGVYPEKPLKYTLTANKPSNTEAQSNVYRPPSARGTTSNFKLHDNEELPQNMAQPQGDKQLSKAALKNKKKREAKKQKQEAGDGGSRPAQPQQVVSQPQSCMDDAEKEKKMKSLKKKLKQIEGLKQQQKEGRVLEVNQMQKLESEDALLQEIEDLELE